MDPLQIVSEWMPNGTLTEFVQKDLGANRIGLVRLFLSLHLTGIIILSRYWMYPKVSIIFTRTMSYMGTWTG